jgi:cache 3/cache 2 fusion protein
VAISRGGALHNPFFAAAAVRICTFPGEGANHMGSKQAAVYVLTLVCLIASAVLMPSAGGAQDAKVKAAMDLLRSKAEKLGPAKIEGTDSVAGKQVPAIYFGSAKQNNDFALVDEVVKEAGGTATIFVKSGDEFVRVATNVKKDDGSRAIGTILDPKGKAIEAIKKNQAFYGDVDILGKPYTTGYEPIRDSGQQVIGILYVGYLK